MEPRRREALTDAVEQNLRSVLLISAATAAELDAARIGPDHTEIQISESAQSDRIGVIRGKDLSFLGKAS